MALMVTYVDKKNNKNNLLPLITNYVLPFSGIIKVRGIESSHIYINGDSYEINDNSKDIIVKDTSMDIEIDKNVYSIRVLSGLFSEEVKFDYNMLKKGFENNLVQGRMDEYDLFSALEEDIDSIKISLCTFNRKFQSIKNGYNLDAMVDCIDYFPHIFQKPKQHLKLINEIRPAAVVSSIGQESIRHLSSHSEHWKGIKTSGLVPERLLARTLEDDFAIYENVAVKTIVDQLYKEMKKLNEENIDCTIQMDFEDAHSVGGEQKTYFHARDLLLKGMDETSILSNQIILEEQRKQIEHILEKLTKCKSTPLYRKLKKQKLIKGKLKKTNIFMMDKYYKQAYYLSELLNSQQEIDNSFEAVQEITSEYSLFCKILFLFALRYFNYNISNSESDIFEEETLLNNNYRFEKWGLEISNRAITSLDVDGFEMEIYINNNIEVNCNPIYIDDKVIAKTNKTRSKGNILIFDKPLEDQEIEELIRKLKGSWPKNKTSWSNDLKTKIVSAFQNSKKVKRKCLFIPWKYPIPDNIEEINQLNNMIKDTIKSDKKLDEYDMYYILTASRPNELENVKDSFVLNGLLSYGKANRLTGKHRDNFGFIPISLGDINSYRRYTKIILEHMIALDNERDLCPICGNKMYVGKGNQKNVSHCHTCEFEIIDTQCKSCGKQFAFTRYQFPKISSINIDNPGFIIMNEENKLGYKNITDAKIEEGKIIPICPFCGE